MKKPIAFWVIVILGLAGLAYDYYSAPSGAKHADNVPQVMDAQDLPDLTLTTMDGEAVSLHDIDAPVILLHFWATWCAPCIVEFPMLLDLLRDMDGDVVMVAVSLDNNREPLDRFIAQQDVTNASVIWVHDDSFDVSYKTFLISQLPETIIIGPKRTMQSKIIGEYDWSGEDIRAQLTALRGGSI